MTPPRRNPSPPQEDPLLDSLLEEVLSGTTPPDLRAQILHRNALPKPRSATDRQGQAMSSPVLASDTFMVPSRLPEAMRRSSGLKAIQVTVLSCGQKERVLHPVSTSQIWTSPAAPLVERCTATR